MDTDIVIAFRLNQSAHGLIDMAGSNAAPEQKTISSVSIHVHQLEDPAGVVPGM
jgi:hypothetical protein